MLKNNGVFVSIVGDFNHVKKFTLGMIVKVIGQLMYRNIMYSQKYKLYDVITSQSKLKELFEFIKKYNITVTIDPETPLPVTVENVNKILVKSQQSKAKGKLVLQFCQ